MFFVTLLSFEAAIGFAGEVDHWRTVAYFTNKQDAIVFLEYKTDEDDGMRYNTAVVEEINQGTVQNAITTEWFFWDSGLDEWVHGTAPDWAAGLTTTSWAF